MDDFWQTITEKLKLFREHWAVYSVLGSGALYLLGYLIIRFQLTMLGVGTNLDVVEEQYFYAGARFAVYLLTSLPSLLILLLPLAALAWLMAKLARALAGPGRLTAFNQWWTGRLRRWQGPVSLRLAGIVFSVLAIQLAARQCFLLHNLLLAQALPETGWLKALLLDTSDARTSLFFAGLLVAVLLTGGFYAAARRWPAEGVIPRGLEFLLVVLLTVQCLLLPVNYACLVSAKVFPRVFPPPELAVEPGQAVWLVWENNLGATFLVGDPARLQHDRALVSASPKAMENLRITAYEPVFRMIFSGPVSTPNPRAP